MYRDDAEHPFVLDQIKQLGLYSDCLGDQHWSLPHEVISAGLAKGLIQTAKVMAGTGTHSVREVELWIEHLGPVWKKQMPLMQRGVIDWHEAMIREGLADPTDSMRDFVHGPQKTV